jgi:hypothetical protein
MPDKNPSLNETPREAKRRDRRDFLRTTGAATLVALAAGEPRALVAAEEEKIRPTADTVILLWMGGGMAATETFDPKRYTPFEKGLESNQVLSTFPSIDTAVDPIKFSAGLERTAAVMDRGTLVRSYTAGDLGFILHSRHQYRRKRSPRRTSARSSPARSGRSTRRCRRSSTSASGLISARAKSSRHSTRPDSWGASSAPLQFRKPTRPWPASARRTA